MHIIVMRHGEAEWNATEDSMRRLTDYGIEQVISTGLQLVQRPYLISRIFVSPYIRARQTGDILVELLSCSGLEEKRELQPNGVGEEVLKWLPEDGVTLLVSHMPLVKRMVNLLCDSSYTGRDTVTTFSVAQAVVIVSEERFGIGLGECEEVVLPQL